MGVRIGYAEFDALAPPFGVKIGWAEFDARSPDNKPVPVYQPGGGVKRYYSNSRKKYNIPLVADIGHDEEEEIIIAILMEIAAHVI